MKSSFTDWLKDNTYSIIYLIVLLVGFAYQYGTISSKIMILDDRVNEAEKKVDLGHPDIRAAFDKRITNLETRTDNLSRLEQIVSTQNDQIRSLADTVSRDHDILLKLVSLMDKR